LVAQPGARLFKQAFEREHEGRDDALRVRRSSIEIQSSDLAEDDRTTWMAEVPEARRGLRDVARMLQLGSEVRQD
jgi:hypothetical protein